MSSHFDSQSSGGEGVASGSRVSREAPKDPSVGSAASSSPEAPSQSWCHLSPNDVTDVEREAIKLARSMDHAGLSRVMGDVMATWPPEALRKHAAATLVLARRKEMARAR